MEGNERDREDTSPLLGCCRAHCVSGETAAADPARAGEGREAGAWVSLLLPVHPVPRGTQILAHPKQSGSIRLSHPSAQTGNAPSAPIRDSSAAPQLLLSPSKRRPCANCSLRLLRSLPRCRRAPRACGRSAPLLSAGPVSRAQAVPVAGWQKQHV